MFRSLCFTTTIFSLGLPAATHANPIVNANFEAKKARHGSYLQRTGGSTPSGWNVRGKDIPVVLSRRWLIRTIPMTLQGPSDIPYPDGIREQG